MGQVLGFNPGTFIADTDNHLFGPRLPADFYLALWSILQRIGDKIVEHLFQACFIRQDDGKLLRKVCDDAVLL